MIRLPIPLLALTLATAACAVHAEDTPSDPWYQVEVIVFEHTRAADTVPGDWQAEVGAPALARALELLPALDPGPEPDQGLDPDPDESDSGILPPGTPVHGSGAAAFRLLDDRELRMAAVMNRLLVAPAYAPLLHVAWRQPATTDPDFGGVRIHTGLGVTADDDSVDDAAARTIAAEDVDADTGADGAQDRDRVWADPEGPEPLEVTPPEPVEGIVRLSRGRFLHLNVDLLYRRPGMTPDPGAGLFAFLAAPRLQTQVLRLTQSRRVRADELQYIDHPRFGAIVLVTPFAPLPEADRQAHVPASQPSGPASDLRVAQGTLEFE